MRIAVVTTVFPTLSQTFVVNQICRLIDLGHEVDIFAMQMGDGPVTSARLNEYDLLSRLRTPPALADHGIRRVLDLASLCTRLSLHSPNAVLRVISNRGPRGIRQADALGHLRQFNGCGQYDAVLCHFGQIGLRMVELRQLGIDLGPIATVFHGADISRYVDQNGPGAFSPLFEQGDLFLPVSSAWAARLRELGCPAAKIRVHRMGVDCEVHSPSQAHKSSSETIRVLSICRLVEKKGIEYAIRAISKLNKQELATQIRYTIIGDGPLLADLKLLTQVEKVDDIVEFAGPQPPEVVADYLAATDLLLAPSVTAADGDKEGIPVAIMEAMAREIPVISTFHSGIPELVEDGDTGWLVPERDAIALSHKMLRAVRHRSSWPSVGRAARAKILAAHDSSSLALELEAMLGEIAA